MKDKPAAPIGLLRFGQLSQIANDGGDDPIKLLVANVGQSVREIAARDEVGIGVIVDKQLAYLFPGRSMNGTLLWPAFGNLP